MRSSNLLSLCFTSAVVAAWLVACSSDDASPPPAGSDAGNPSDAGGGSDGGGGGGEGGGGGDSGGGTDGGGDGGVDAGPTTPATARTITAADTVTGVAPGGTDAGHWFKYVPTQAFTSVSVNVTTLGPSTSFGDIRWQTDTTLGLCDVTGGVKCCTTSGGPGACNLTIREGASPTFAPVVVGKTYYIIVLGGNAGATTNYAFTLTETP